MFQTIYIILEREYIISVYYNNGIQYRHKVIVILYIHKYGEDV